MREDRKLEENLVRILYETPPEKVEKLSKRLMPVAASMEVRQSEGKTYLEVTVRDDFFNVCIRKRNERVPPAARDKKTGEGITIAAAFRYLCSHSMEELADYTALSKSTCYRRIAQYKQDCSWREDSDLLYF